MSVQSHVRGGGTGKRPSTHRECCRRASQAVRSQGACLARRPVWSWLKGASVAKPASRAAGAGGEASRRARHGNSRPRRAAGAWRAGETLALHCQATGVGVSAPGARLRRRCALQAVRTGLALDTRGCVCLRLKAARLALRAGVACSLGGNGARSARPRRVCTLAAARPRRARDALSLLGQRLERARRAARARRASYR